MTVFVDTSAFMAVLNADDRFHESAQTVWQEIITRNELLVCNNYILVEAFALLQSRFGLTALQVFQSDIVPVLTVSWVEPEIHERATSALLAANRRQLSLVDCTAMETMRTLEINRVFTFDPHFAQYGFRCIPELPKE